jgi:hypothetical protein
MCFAFSLIPATFWLVIGYFVLFVSTRAEGGVRRFGRILAAWIFLVAALMPIMGAYVTLSGLCPLAQLLQR